MLNSSQFQLKIFCGVGNLVCSCIEARGVNTKLLVDLPVLYADPDGVWGGGGDILHFSFWVIFDNAFQMVKSKLISLRFLSGSGGLFDLVVRRSIDFLVFNVSWCCSNVVLL